MPSIISASTTSGTALTFTADTSGVLALQTGATPTTAVTIDTSQNVGIGTASPSSRLSVGGNPPTSGTIAGVCAAAGRSLALSDNVNSSLYVTHPSGLPVTLATDSGGAIAFATNGTTERMRIDASGNVGIGITNASAKLDVIGTSKVTGLLYVQAPTNTATFQIYGASSATDGAWAIKSQATRSLTFVDDYAGTERMRIDSSGNVCVGTATALYTAANRGNITLNGSTSSILGFGYGGTAGGYLYCDSGQIQLWCEGSRTLSLGTASAGVMTFLTNNTERMRITTGGNVGIGTTTVDVPSGFSRFVAIGDSDTGIGQISDGILAFSTNLAERMRITAGGNLAIGATSSDFRLRADGSMAAHFGDGYDGAAYGAVQITRPASQGTAFHLSFIRAGQKVAGIGFLNNSNTFAIQNASNNSGSGVGLTDGATSWSTVSDERKKDIIGNVENALTKLADWRSVYYKYKNDEADAPQRVGLIAQDVQATLPEAVSAEEDELQTLQVRYTETIPLLVKAIQELKAELDATKAEVAALKGAK